MITWSIDKITTVPQVGAFSDVVKEIDWKCSATVGEETRFTYGRVALTLDGAALEDFTDYGDLTNDQVVGWVKSALGEQTVAYQENLALQLAITAANPQTKTSALPW